MLSEGYPFGLEFTGSAASCWGHLPKQVPRCAKCPSGGGGHGEPWVLHQKGSPGLAQHSYPFLKHPPLMATRWRCCLVYWKIHSSWTEDKGKTCHLLLLPQLFSTVFFSFTFPRKVLFPTESCCVLQ